MGTIMTIKEIKKNRETINMDMVKYVLTSMRQYKRRTVVWSGTLFVGQYSFKTTVYDISLGGARIKMDLPLEVGAHVRLKIRDKTKLAAEVAWHADGFLGVSFDDDADVVQQTLGPIVADI
ncbi:MAG: hypothetical protein CMF31_01395 [Kordiimonas sp.]|nr:hypothetical protein [Kordiimonas sp.]|tara:strand:- start:3431 stop:3793 length:363 start_codon:yes stop_codon:yes gene_type:complete